MADSETLAHVHEDVLRSAFAGFGAQDPGAIADRFHEQGELVLHGGWRG